MGWTGCSSRKKGMGCFLMGCFDSFLRDLVEEVSVPGYALSVLQLQKRVCRGRGCLAYVISGNENTSS